MQNRIYAHARLSLLGTVLLLSAPRAWAQLDAPVSPVTSWYFSSDSIFDYVIPQASDVSDPSLYSGPYPAFDPTLNLVVGRRYRITNEDASFHPLQILALSDESSIVLLAQTSERIGTFENDPGVDWFDDGGTSDAVIEFTLTPELYAAMLDNSGGIERQPGYDCANHETTMRGFFNVTVPETTPTPTMTPLVTVTPSITTVATTPTMTVVPTTATPTATPSPTLDVIALVVDSLLGNGAYRSAYNANLDEVFDVADVVTRTMGHQHHHER